MSDEGEKVLIKYHQDNFDDNTDLNGNGDDYEEPAINFAIRSTKRLKRLGKLLKGSGGKIVVLKAPGNSCGITVIDTTTLSIIIFGIFG